MTKILLILCLFLATFSTVFVPSADATNFKKTHISSMAQLKKSAIFMKKQVIIEPIAGPVTPQGQAIYASIASAVPVFIGTPYAFGGTTPIGFDCSGFIHYVHQMAGLKLARMSSEDYFKESSKVLLPEVGDLVFFKDTYKIGISHMGIYMGNNEFVHASSRGVELTKLDNSYWQKHFVGFKRFHLVTTN